MEGFKSSLLKIATAETLAIYQALSGRIHRVQPIKLGDKVALESGGLLRVHPAGHMLGAVQFSLERNGTTLVYTGDFNLKSSLTAAGANPIPCDILMMEATYGRPGALFPPREQVYTEIADWTSRELKRKRVPAFQVYATGKAQELIRVINTFLTVPVVVDPVISKVNEVYCDNDVSLRYHSVTSPDGQEIIRSGEYVYVSSRRLDDSKSPSGFRFARATATGWASLFPLKRVDKAFVLSAHADFQQLLQYVEEAQPQAVYLTCGDTVTFGAILEKLRIKQIVPYQRPQLRLSDFL